MRIHAERPQLMNGQECNGLLWNLTSAQTFPSFLLACKCLWVEQETAFRVSAACRMPSDLNIHFSHQGQLRKHKHAHKSQFIQESQEEHITSNTSKVQYLLLCLFASAWSDFRFLLPDYSSAPKTSYSVCVHLLPFLLLKTVKTHKS